MQLPSFKEPIQVALIGSSGGIGEALLKLLLSSQDVSGIDTFSRSTHKFEAISHSAYRHFQCNITEPSELESLCHDLKGTRYHCLINTTGLLHTDAIKPEKTLKSLELDALEQVFKVNTFAPALVIKHFFPLMVTSQKAVMSFLSARVGSISDNRLGGWYAYRSSKSALNMLIKCASIEVQRQRKNLSIIGLHPGTVDTNLSKPFQSGAKKLFSPEESAHYLLKVIENLAPEDSGNVLDWQGKIIEP